MRARAALRIVPVLQAVFCGGLILLGAQAPRAQSAAAVSLEQSGENSGAIMPDGALTLEDVEAAVDRMDSLGRFFGAFAARDTNGFARERWRRLSVNYADTAEIFRALLAKGGLTIEDLPEGRRSGLLDDGRIVLDHSLDGRWLPILPQMPEADAAEAVRQHDFLLPALMQGLARRLPSADWPWLADHLRAVGGLAKLAQEPAARPLLARFFQAKDAYLWLAMQRIAEGDPALRQALARRQINAFDTIRALRSEMAATFGLEPAERLQREWLAYVAQVDGFAVTRGWLLLDPALRLTQLGTAAQQEADAVDRAAAEVVASAPRSAVAAATAGVGSKTAAVRPEDRLAPAEAAEPGVNLGAIMAQVEATALEELAAQLAVAVLAMRPELSAGATSPAAVRAFVARVKEALDQPDLRLVLAEREAALGAAREELSGLKARVSELDAALRAGAEEAARLEVALAAEREGLIAAERRWAEERSAAQDRAAESEKPVAEQAAVTQAPMPEIVVVPTVAATEGLAPMLSRIEQRQVYMMGAIAVIFLMALLLWLRGRRRVAVVEQLQAPLLLQAPMARQPAPAAMPLRPVIEVAETSAPAETATVAPPPPAPPQQHPKQEPQQPPQRVRVSGVKPTTRAATAAMKAGTAQAAALGSEADAAAHPVVQALRKGNLPLFELLFSEMTGLHSPQLQRITYGGRGEDLAIVCRAVGIGKLLFGSIYLLTDSLRGGDANEDPERAAEILRMYDRTPPETAQKVLMKWQHNWGEEAVRPEESSLG